MPQPDRLRTPDASQSLCTEPSGANTPTSPVCTQPSPKLSTDKNAESAKYSRATAHADVSEFRLYILMQPSAFHS
jgi:hypothetical protein